MKCEQYWPDEEKEVRYGHVRVKRRRVKEFAEYTIRSFTISKVSSRLSLYVTFPAYMQGIFYSRYNCINNNRITYF